MLKTNIKPSLSGSYVPAVSMKAASKSVQQARTRFGTGQYISWAANHATMQSEQLNPPAIIHYPRT